MVSRASAIKIGTGDFFEIPLSNGQFGYGQVVVEGKVFYVIIFRNIYTSRPPLEELQDGELLLVGWTVDALIYAGRWLIIGNRKPALTKVPFPSYKVVVAGKEHIHDFDGTNYRPAEASELEVVDYKTTVAPIRYQRALAAHHGLGEWQEEYSRLTATGPGNNCQRTAEGLKTCQQESPNYRRSVELFSDEHFFMPPALGSGAAKIVIKYITINKSINN
jgi:hypothetical protein